MKATSSFILFLLLTLALNSCGFIHYMGTKDPSDESGQAISEYLEKHDFTFADYSVLLHDSLVDSLSTPIHALDTWKLERGTPQSLMQLRVYDSLGKLVNGYAQCYGPFKRLNILKTKELQFFKHLPNNMQLRLSDEFSLWDISPGEKQQFITGTSQNTYTFVVYWNMWSNHYSEVMLKAVKKYIKRYERADFKVRVILVNTGAKPKAIP